MPTEKTPFCVCLSPDASSLAVSGMYGSLVHLHRLSGAIREFKDHKREIKAVVFSCDGKFLFSAGADKTAIKWCVDSGALLWRVDMPTWVQSLLLVNYVLLVGLYSSNKMIALDSTSGAILFEYELSSIMAVSPMSIMSSGTSLKNHHVLTPQPKTLDCAFSSFNSA
jgi:WD40 repeat protein